MAAREYITLQCTDSSGSNGIGTEYKFSVVKWQPVVSKATGLNRTLGGALDVAHGAVYKSLRYVLYTKDPLETTVGYGTKETLDGFFELNNSSGSPSSVFLHKDNLYPDNGKIYRVVLIGDHSPEPLSTILTGYSARYYIPVRLEVLGE